jgi:hypothetical protein
MEGKRKKERKEAHKNLTKREGALLVRSQQAGGGICSREL